MAFLPVGYKLTCQYVAPSASLLYPRTKVDPYSVIVENYS